MHPRLRSIQDRLRRHKLSCLAVAIAAVAGCSMMNPYDHVKLVRDKSEEPDEFPKNLRLAGQASEGLQAADALRQTYYNNLRYTSYVRNGTAVAASALTGWAIYNALKPEGSGPSVSDGDTRRGVRLGATLAVLYGLRQLFVNPEQESIHAEGYRSLTCLMLQSAPLLMTEAIPPDTSASGAAPTAPTTKVGTIAVSMPASGAASSGSANAMNAEAYVLPPAYTETNLGDMDRLQMALDKLERRILELNLLVARTESSLSAISAGSQTSKDSQKYLTDQIDASKKALEYARSALQDGRLLVRTVRGAGRTIRDRVGIIVSVVNEQVQKGQNNLRQAADVLKDAHDITSGILGIGGETAAVQAVRADSPTTHYLDPGEQAILLAGPMSAATDLLAQFTKPRPQPPMVLAQASPVEGTSATRATVKPESAASQVAKVPAKKKAAAAAALKPETLTAEELKAIRDTLDVAIKRMDASRLEAEKKAALAPLQKQIDEDKKAIAKLTAQSTARACNRAVESGGCAVELAEETERLYAARRPVVQELLNFRRKTREVLATPECAELAILRVTPNEVLRGRPGDTLSYLISQRAPGTPAVVLEGPHDEKEGVKFDFMALPATSPSLFMAKVQIGKNMKEQTIRLVVTDSKGIASQTVFIAAGSANAPAAASSPASGANAASPPASAASPAAKG